MGCTLRAALDVLPQDARVTVCELNPIVADWCRGPLATLSGDALADARVSLLVGDVAEHVRSLAARGRGAGADAILLDLFEGPHARTDAVRDPFYGAHALARSRSALAPDGVFAIWSEAPDAAFERRLARAGFVDVAVHRPGRGGRRHAVYVARVGGGRPPGSPGGRAGRRP
jgi:spermidine synthase